MIRRTLALGMVATAAWGAFATAPAEASTVCMTDNPYLRGCVSVVENDCLVAGGGTFLSSGYWTLGCVDI